MPFIDTNILKVIERLPGWQGRYFHSPSMTFAHYDFKRGSSIQEHFHPQEEVYEVIEGELELTIGGVKQVVRPGESELGVMFIPAGSQRARMWNAFKRAALEAGMTLRHNGDAEGALSFDPAHVVRANSR